MDRIKVHVSMSLDGYTAGPNVDVEHPMGEGGMWLHEWLFADPAHPVDARIAGAMFDRNEVGAVLMGRRTFDVGIGRWGRDGTFGLPCFVVTHRPASTLHVGDTCFEFVTGGIGSALTAARRAASGLDVNVMGAELTRQMLVTGLIDEIEIDVVPIILGGGASLFGGLHRSQIDLEQISAACSPTVSHVRYRVMTPPST